MQFEGNGSYTVGSQPTSKICVTLRLEYAVVILNVLVRPGRPHFPYYATHNRNANLARFRVLGAKGYGWEIDQKVNKRLRVNWLFLWV